jgi:hypothetical protein
VHESNGSSADLAFDIFQKGKRDGENVEVQERSVHLLHWKRERSGHLLAEKKVRFHEAVHSSEQIEEPICIWLSR